MAVLSRKLFSLSFIIALALVLLLFGTGWIERTKDEKLKQVLVKQDVMDLGSSGRDAKPQFQFVNHIVTEFDRPAAEIVKRLVSRKASSNDSELIAIVRHLLDPPPNYGTLTLSTGLLDTPQSKEVDSLLQKKTNGFFVECGALDGERASNSLPLEMQRQWTGILIEANPFYYTQLLGKNRNVWSLNACLSPFDYAAELQFESSKGHAGRVILDKNKQTKQKTDSVPCFPLETILLALNRSHVDYLSLDVEGLELDVLKTIPYERVDISILSVEYKHGGTGKDAYKRFMESKGYRTHKELIYNEPRAGLFAEDYIFVTNKKDHLNKLSSPV